MLVHFLTDPAEPIEAPVDRYASLTAAPMVGDFVVFEPGIVREFQVDAIRWVITPPHSIDRGSPDQLATLVVFLKEVRS